MKKRRLLIFAVASCFFWGDKVFSAENIEFTLPSGVRIEITETPFDQAPFKVSGCNGNSSVCIINDHIPFGTDSTLPKTYTKSIVASYQGKSYSLNSSDMYNAWGTRPLELKGIRYFGGKCFDVMNCKFRGLFSDAAGSFVAEWMIVNGTPIRTVLTDSNDVVDLFIRHIDPPEFE